MTEQVSHAVEAIKLAYLSHTPVVWLVTSDKEVASEIVEQFTIEHFGTFRSAKMPHAVLLKEFSDRSSDSSTTPSVFYLWHSKNGSDDGTTSTVMNSIEKFITSHLNMVVDPNVQAMTDDHIQSTHLSLAIVASPTLPPESWLTKYIEVVYVKALQDGEIREIILNALSSKGIDCEDKYRLSQLIVNLRGFSSRKISQAISRCILSGFFDFNTIQWPKILREIRFMKRQMLEGFVGLKWIDVRDDKYHETIKREQSKVSESLDVISGWLDDRREIFEDTENARKQYCPYCNIVKGEYKISQYLIRNGIAFEGHKTYENLLGVKGGKLSYDFYVPKYNLLIEFQGEQHEHPIDHFGGEEQFKTQLEHDKRKREYAMFNNIELLEIWYYDFNNIEAILNDKLTHCII